MHYWDNKPCCNRRYYWANDAIEQIRFLCNKINRGVYVYIYRSWKSPSEPDESIKFLHARLTLFLSDFRKRLTCTPIQSVSENKPMKMILIDKIQRVYFFHSFCVFFRSLLTSFSITHSTRGRAEMRCSTSLLFVCETAAILLDHQSKRKECRFAFKWSILNLKWKLSSVAGGINERDNERFTQLYLHNSTLSS